MGKLIALTGGKGGCGKTTLTAALGAALSSMGKKVCLVDACVGMRGLDMALGMQDRLVYDLYDLSQDFCPMDQALLKVEALGVSLVGAPQLDVCDEMDAKNLRRLFDRLTNRFDYVLADTHPVISPLTLRVCQAADEIALIALPGGEGERAAERAAALLRENTHAPLSLIVNCFSEKQVRLGYASPPDGLSAYLDIPLLGLIPLHQSIYEAALQGRLPGGYPDKVQSAVLDAAKRLEGASIPFPSFHARRFLWHSSREK